MAEPTTPPARPDLLVEMAGCWRRIPDKGLFFGLLAAWLVLFQFLGNSTLGYVDTNSLLYWMFNAYNSPNSDDGHGNLIPFVVLILLWLKRDELLTLTPRIWPPALALLFVALALHWVGFVVQQPRISIVGFFFGIYSLAGLIWGPQCLRAIFFPFVLFAFCVPVGSYAEKITFPLRMFVTHASVAIAHTGLGIDVIRDGSRIFDADRTFQYDVAPACSGIRSLISLLALTTIYGFLSFRKTWKRVLMVAVSVPLAVAGNVVRITTVILAGEIGGQNAGLLIENKFGFVTFAFAVVCMLSIGWLIREKDAPGGESAEAPASGAFPQPPVADRKSAIP
ncbi:MAG: exosortase/archaeosortase family protein [Verrucomicrobiota bacterium]